MKRDRKGAGELMLSRAEGCLLAQLAGDALGSAVEFQIPEQIKRAYPRGLRQLLDGGTWNTIAGQPTDDSEMALALARSLVAEGDYKSSVVRTAYVDWLDSGPFDYGATISGALRGRLDPQSQSNGAMMRVSPLGIFGANSAPARVAGWARQDTALTHSNPICQQANALYVMAIAEAVRTGPEPRELYRRIVEWAVQMKVDGSLMQTVVGAEDGPPADYLHQQGWVMVALGNALHRLLEAESLESAVVDTVMQGGDTDTNAAICGELLGAVHGRGAIPAQWIDSLLTCRPADGDPRVMHPRPECYWPVDALRLAASLLRS